MSTLFTSTKNRSAQVEVNHTTDAAWILSVQGAHHLCQYEVVKAREEQLKQQQADFLAPYFLRLGDTKKHRPTRQVMRLYRNCTADLRKFYQRLEEEMRNRCDDLITEEQSLKRFLSRFQQHFEDAEYELFIAEGETLEHNKHILQMRLENIQDEYRRKADHLKQALREDERLKPFFSAELAECEPSERSDYGGEQ